MRPATLAKLETEMREIHQRLGTDAMRERWDAITEEITENITEQFDWTWEEIIEPQEAEASDAA